MELEKLTALQLADKIKKHEVSVLDGVKDVFSKIEEKDNRRSGCKSKRGGKRH